MSSAPHHNFARLRAALDRRSTLSASGTTGFRMVHAQKTGFSLYAARGGARSVTSVAAAGHQVIRGDAFEVMAAMRDRGERAEGTHLPSVRQPPGDS